MYKICLIIERGFQFLKTKLLILILKIRYGKRIIIGRNFKVRKRFDIYIGPNAKLINGDNVFFNNDCSINCMNQIYIGNDNLFGENVRVYDHNHIFNNKKLNKNISFSVKKVIIGNNNWIGSNVTILSNSIIGDNNVIGANTVVNEEIKNDNLIKLKNNVTISKITYK